MLADPLLLKLRVKQMEEELTTLRAEWYTAIIASSELKEGDLVKVITPRNLLIFEEDLKITGSTPLPPKIEFGRVRSVKVRYDRLYVEIAPQTKSGYHATRTIDVGYHATVEKLPVAPESVK